MIESIRNQMQKKGSKLILWLMLLGFAGSSLIGLVAFSGRFRKTSIATVNGNQEIDVKEFQQHYLSLVEQIKYIRKMAGENADSFLKQFGFTKSPEEIALEGLIFQKALQSTAQQIGTSISDDYVEAKLKDPYFVKEFLRDLIPAQAMTGSSIDVASLQRFLRAQGISEAEFEKTLKETMERVLLVNLIGGAVYVPEATLKETYEADFLKKKYGLATLSLNDYLKKAEAQKPSEESLKTYFEGHKDNYRIPEKRSARLWTFSPETYGAKVDEKDLQSAYEERKKIFVDKPEEYEVQRILLKFTDTNKNEVRRQGQELVKAIKEKPESFNELVSKHSQAKEKIETITVRKGERGNVFERFVFVLKPGEVTPVIETSEGFEIVKLIKKREQTYKPFEDVKEQVARSLKQEKFDAEFNAAAQRVLKQVADVPTALSSFIKDKKAHETLVGDIASTEKTQRAQKLFSLKKVGDKTFVVEDGKGFIIELASITPSRIPDFESVKDNVAKDFYRSEALKAVEADVQAMAARVKDKKEPLEKVALAFKAAYTTTELSQPSDPLFAKKGIPSHKVKELKQVHDVTAGVSKETGFVVELLEKEPFVEKDFTEKKAALRAQAARKEAEELLDTAMRGIRKNAQVKMHVDVTRSARPRR